MKIKEGRRQKTFVGEKKEKRPKQKKEKKRDDAGGASRLKKQQPEGKGIAGGKTKRR